MDLLRQIQFNIENLSFSIRFNSWDLTPEEQNKMLMKCDEIQGILNRIQERKRKQQ